MSGLGSTLDWWAVTVSILAGGFGIFGLGFRLLGNRLSEFHVSIKSNFDAMERTNNEHQSEVTRQIHGLRTDMTRHEEKFHNLSLQLVQRVAWIEAHNHIRSPHATHHADQKGDN